MNIVTPKRKPKERPLNGPMFETLTILTSYLSCHQVPDQSVLLQGLLWVSSHPGICWLLLWKPASSKAVKLKQLGISLMFPFTVLFICSPSPIFVAIVNMLIVIIKTFITLYQHCTFLPIAIHVQCQDLMLTPCTRLIAGFFHPFGGWFEPWFS